MSTAPSRRDFLLLGGGAAVWLAGDPALVRGAFAAAEEARRPGAVPRFDVLTPQQASDIEAICARIIPSDDLPGAREARAIVFIDRSLATFAQDQRDPMLQGLADLNRRVAERWPGTVRFAQLDESRQDEVLRTIEGTGFFQEVRYATICGTFANPSWGGNHESGGWRILGFEPRFAWQPPFGEYDIEANGGGR